METELMIKTVNSRNMSRFGTPIVLFIAFSGKHILKRFACRKEGIQLRAALPSWLVWWSFVAGIHREAPYQSIFGSYCTLATSTPKGASWILSRGMASSPEGR